mgnify:CR=1 FL=1
MPVEPYPQYMVPGTSSHIAALREDGRYAELRIPLAELDPKDASFTYPDCMVSLHVSEHDRGKPDLGPEIHGKVFTLPETMVVVSTHGLPDGEWNTAPERALGFFVADQVWSFRPLRKYMGKRNQNVGPIN